MTVNLSEILKNLDSMGETVTNAGNFDISDLQRPIDKLATLTSADDKSISFLNNAKYRDALKNTQAAAVLVSVESACDCPKGTIPLIVQSPYLAYAKLTQYFAFLPDNISPLIHPTAIVSSTAIIGKNVKIGAYCRIDDGVVIGDNTLINSHVVVEAYAKVGKDCHLNSHGFIGHHCELGDEVVLHSHASIGNEGFGYAPKGDTAKNGWQKIHQLGRVIIGNKVRIGSHTCVDRGTLDDTVIEDNVIIDNLVQIAHNVRVGSGTAIAACVGIAGSTDVGKRCILAGGVGLVGHISLCDDVTITGMTMVTKSIKKPGSYSSGTPMLPTPVWKRAAIKFKQLVNSE